MPQQSAVVIVTRFSTYWKDVLPSKEWVDYRFDLLKRTALPSLTQQTRQDFVWVLKTAPDYHEYVKSLFRSVCLSGSAIKIVSERRNGEIRAEELEEVHPGRDEFVTFRLDSDDAFSAKTIERVLSSAGRIENESVLFNLPSGIQLDWETGEMFYFTFRPHRQGPYFARTNSSRDKMLFIGGNKGGHLVARKDVAKVVHLSGLNWLQVVHGTNISNTVRYKKFRYKAPVAALLSAGALLYPRLKSADLKKVPTELQASVLAEFGVRR